MGIDDFTRLVKELTGGEFTLKESRMAIDAVVEAIRQVILNDNHIYLYGLGKFSQTTYKKLQGRDFSTGKTIALSPRSAPKFTFAKGFREEVMDAE